MLYGTDSTMEKTVTADFGSQTSNNGDTNGSTKIDTTFLHPRVHNLAFIAFDKAQKIVLKQTAGFKGDPDTQLH
jgi:hypothetical protein